MFSNPTFHYRFECICFQFAFMVFRFITQRFGVALRRDGPLKLHQPQFKNDLKPIDENCDCSTCKHYTRAYLSQLVRFEPVGASLVTVHNVAYQVGRFSSKENIVSIFVFSI